MDIPGARTVDVRNTSGGITRITSIPTTSQFANVGGRGAPCEFVAAGTGFASNGEQYVAGQLVRSDRWIFYEDRLSAFGEPNVEAPEPRGRLADAVRHFVVYCDSNRHFWGLLDVSARDPLLDPRLQLSRLYHSLQLEQPVVVPDPVVDRWGGLVTRAPAWLAIAPSAWRPQRSGSVTWRGWTMYLLARPVSLSFDVRFVPDPAHPTRPFTGVVACEGTSADAAGFPARPALPETATPGAGGPCTWTPPGPGTVTIRPTVTYALTFWANGYTEELPDYRWSGPAVTLPTGDLAVVNVDQP